jgi:hypothetical protein
MADTLVDAVEPVPPTQRDPEPAPPAVEPQKQSSKRMLAVAVVAVVVLGSIAAAALWMIVFRYKPTALAHVPAGSNVVVRIEGADILLFGPVRNHLLPLVLEDKPKGPALKKVPWAERLHDRTGVRLPMDVREMLLATMDGKSFVGLFGGKISQGKFVSGLAEVAQEEGWAGFHLENELLVGPNVVVGQADDGTIVVGTDKAIVTTALPATEEGAKLGLPEQGAVRFVVAKPAWETVSMMGTLVPEVSAFRGVRRGTGSFTLGGSPELVLQLEPMEGADSAAIEQGVTALLANLRLLTLLAPDRIGEKDALRHAVVSREGAKVVVRAPWPTEGLDQAAAMLAARLRANSGSDAVPAPTTP